MGTEILHNEAELNEWLKTGTYQDMMMESYVEGDIYHIDGIVTEGEVKFIVASAYLYTCFSFKESQGFGSIILSHDNPLGQRLIAFVRQVLDVLPTPEATTLFHAEVFHTPQDELLLCEIASRTAGGKAGDMFQRTFGIEFDRYVARAQVGLHDPLPVNTEQMERFGMFYVPPKVGILRAMPEEIPFARCEYYIPTGQIGNRYNGPQRCTDNYCIVAVRGQTDVEVRERLVQLIDYVEAHTVWEA